MKIFILRNRNPYQPYLRMHEKVRQGSGIIRGVWARVLPLSPKIKIVFKPLKIQKVIN